MLQPVGRNKNASAEFWEFSWILPGRSRSKLPRVGSFRELLFPFVSLLEARTPEDPDAHRGGGATFGRFSANDDQERRCANGANTDSDELCKKIK